MPFKRNVCWRGSEAKLPTSMCLQDGFVGVKNSKEIFYADCTPEDQKHYISQLRLHSFK